MEIRYDTSKGETAPVIIDGPVPVDQSSLVVQLTGERDVAVAAATRMQGRLDEILVIQEARKVGDASSVEGQDVIDIIKRP